MTTTNSSAEDDDRGDDVDVELDITAAGAPASVRRTRSRSKLRRRVSGFLALGVALVGAGALYSVLVPTAQTAHASSATDASLVNEGQQLLNLSVARDQIRQNVMQAWAQLEAAKNSIESSKAQVKSAEAALNGVRTGLGFYIGGMGAKGQNYHTKLMARMGYEEEAYRVQDLFFEGKREEAIAAVPEEFADEISLVGPPSRIRKRLEAWRASPVTTLLVGGRDAEQLQVIRDLVMD